MFSVTSELITFLSVNCLFSFSLSVKEELLRNPNLMPFGLWLFTVLCVAIAIIFGLVSSIFAIINTVMAPGEVISGIHGLFLWNGMGGKKRENHLRRLRKDD